MKQPHFQRFIKSLVAGVAVLSLAALFGLLVPSPSQAATGGRDYSSNSIISGGALTANELIQKLKANKPNDLKSIFNSYGLTAAKYDRFLKTAQKGTAYKNGTIVVNGQTVATNAKSLGRHKNTYTMNKNIAGKTYYESYSKDVFLSNSIPALVMFNAKGQMEFAVLTSCANPIDGVVVTPKHSCNSLKKTKVNKTTYDFTAKASASNNASLAYGIIDYGDGKKSAKIPAAKLNGTTKFRHVYAKAGTYKATLTIYVNVPGKQTITIKAAGNCIQTVKVELPPPPPPPPSTPIYSCDRLNISPMIGTDDSYIYSINYTAENGAELVSVSYDPGDSSGRHTTQNLNDGFAYTYTTSGKYTIKAYAQFKLPSGQLKTATGNCNGNVTISPVYICSLLEAKSINKDNTEFRFTVNHSERRATLKKAVFSLDNKSGQSVAVQPGQAIYKDYTFNDGKKHSVTATLHYDLGRTSATTDCSAEITAKLPPRCPIEGKENLSPDSADCYAPCPSNPKLPIDDSKCGAPVAPTKPDLPSTGPGHVAAMFTLLAGLGGLTHYYLKRRSLRLAGVADSVVTATSRSDLASKLNWHKPNQDETELAHKYFSRQKDSTTNRRSYRRLIQKTLKRP